MVFVIFSALWSNAIIKSLITQSRMLITSRVDESHYEKITPYIAQKMLYWHCGKSIKIIPHFGINWAKTAGPIFPKCGIIMIFFAAMSAPHFLSQCAADIFPQNIIIDVTNSFSVSNSHLVHILSDNVVPVAHRFYRSYLVRFQFMFSQNFAYLILGYMGVIDC